jgi:hypothetical protein
MAYDPLTGRYTPDPVAPSNFTYGQGNPLSNVYVPPAAVVPTRATPGQFRRAEDTSNIGAPVYTPTPLTETGEFVEPTPASDYVVNPNDERQVLYKGTPFSGMRNGIQFINGYRQDLYTPDGKDRTFSKQPTDADPYAKYLKDVKSQEGVSAYNLLLNEFTQYGLGALVSDIRELLVNNTPPSEMSLVLQKTPSYQARFSANKDRIAAGLRVLRPAEYIALEDQYQNVMRQYGLPASYYTKDDTGKQSGFDKFIAGDVSAAELEDRIATAQKRVLNANPEVSTALKQFYPDITNGDILAYTLDPTQAIEGIKRKVTAAEIGGAAMAQGLQTGVNRAEELARYGVTAQAAREGFQTVAAVAPRGSQLAEIYQTGPYGQAQVEEEVFKLGGAAESRKRREKLVSLETAQFSGTAGRAAGALGRERAMGQGQI